MRIIPIASGKGGVGKSLIAANLAIALAEANRRVVLGDLDLGGSNLHLILGVRSPGRGLGSVLTSGKHKFDEAVVETEYPGLRFISGDGEIPGLANVTANQKRSLIHKLTHLDTDYLVLDLGAGTNYNTLDFFLTARHGMVVTTPTPTATVNAYLFLKNVLFRAITARLPRKSSGNSYINSLRKDGEALKRIYLPNLLEKLQEVDPEHYPECAHAVRSLQPRLILNLLEDPKDAEKANKLRRSCREYLGLELEHTGVIYRDDLQDVALSARLPIIRYKPQSVLAQAVYRIADKLVQLESDEEDDVVEGGDLDQTFQEAALEAEADFSAKLGYVEDLLHSGALSTGDLVETIKMQQIEINQLKKENNLIKSKLVRAIQQGFVE